ncbi:TRAP transporter substrate-binding protein [Ramlibacter sp.]|uniref:TRAP transporter substrate-binding protein n=1 Tax=Ramlibacter sp. TaxID=1917967 RepID=UPI003D10C4B0
MKPFFRHLFACAALAGSAAAFAAPIELRLATQSPGNSPFQRTMQKFADIVAAETKGEVKVKIYTDGQLGDIPQLLSGMQLGTQDMAYFGLGSALFLKDAAPLQVIYVPYLFDSKQGAARALNSAPMKGIYEDIARKTGVRIFAVSGARSPRALQTTKGPITKPEQLKGLKMRIPAIPIFDTTFRTLGVRNVPMNMTEMFTAFSAGTIEGQDNGADLSIPFKFHEAAKHWSATDHVFEQTGWFVSDKTWARLTPAQQAILLKASIEAGKVADTEIQQLDDQVPSIMKAAGATYTEPDRDAFRKALAGVAGQFEGKVWPAGLVDQLRKAQR